MSNTSIPQITTPQALSNTIKNDSYVLWWFASLIVQPKLRAYLNQKQDSNIRLQYQRLARILLLRALGYFILLCLGYQAISTRQWWLAGFLPAMIWIFFLIKKTFSQTIEKISSKLIEKDFPHPLLNQKTIFQIGEFYSRRYQVPSLVDNITSMDNAGRLLVFVGLLTLQQLVPILTNFPQFNIVISLIIVVTLSQLSFYLFKTLSLTLQISRPLI